MGLIALRVFLKFQSKRVLKSKDINFSKNYRMLQAGSKKRIHLKEQYFEKGKFSLTDTFSVF